jgi:membrane protein DedA with SNARE-associated domain
MDLAGLVLDFIADYGLLALLVLLTLDAAMLLPVFPGELVLVMAVAAYAPDLPSLVLLIALSTAASLLGSLLLYAIMRAGGRRLVERHPRLFMMPRRRRERLERTFSRPVGQSLVLFLRLVPLTRILVNIPAGLARMPVLRFVVLSTLGLLAYHAAFLAFAYEVRRPGSTLAAQRQQLQDAYASPAMDYVAANAIVAGIAVLSFGAITSVRASREMLRDPEEGTGSPLGWLTTVVLLVGGLVLGVASYLAPESVIHLAALRGVDVAAVAEALWLTVPQLLAGAASLMVLLGAVLRGLAAQAKRRQRRYQADKKAYLARYLRPEQPR